jgi:thiol-disulfide isomerase/thioredoxin
MPLRMAVRVSSVIRLTVLIGVSAIAALALIRPFNASGPAQIRANPHLPVERVTQNGLVITTGADLIRRIGHSRAKGVIVSAWASWCGSCKQDMPLLIGLKKTFGTAVDVALVSVDEQSSEPDAAEMLRSMGAPPPNFIVDEPLSQFKAEMNPKWPGMLPATFLFDTAGKLHYFWGGPMLEGEIVPLLRRYLAGENIDGEADFALAPGAVTR